MEHSQITRWHIPPKKGDSVLLKPASLNKNGDFRRLYSRGKSAVHPVLVVYVMKNRTVFCRLGITTGKKVGNAVCRNRSKRIIREAYRKISPKLNGNYDMVFVARATTPQKKSDEIYVVMEKLLNKLGILK
ncbi:MAG: ribonuclease P protein component [Clostridia bacterium]|nr:ribonuclease P protein component [Clostridia bacterium]